MKRIFKITTIDFTTVPPALKNQKVEADSVQINEQHGYLCFYSEAHMPHLAPILVRIIREWSEVELLDE